MISENNLLPLNDTEHFLKNFGSITNFVGFPIPLVALSAHIE